MYVNTWQFVSCWHWLYGLIGNSECRCLVFVMFNSRNIIHPQLEQQLRPTVWWRRDAEVGRRHYEPIAATSRNKVSLNHYTISVNSCCLVDVHVSLWESWKTCVCDSLDDVISEILQFVWYITDSCVVDSETAVWPSLLTPSTETWYSSCKNTFTYSPHISSRVPNTPFVMTLSYQMVFTVYL